MKRLLGIVMVMLVLGIPAQTQTLQQETFSQYMAALPVVSQLSGSEPMIVLQSGRAAQTPLNTVRSVGGAGIIVFSRSSSAATVTVSALTDYFLCLDPTANAITVNLPPSPPIGLTFLIKDCTGQSATHNITVSPASGNIDGIASLVMGTGFQSVAVTYTGAQWSIN